MGRTAKDNRDLPHPKPVEKIELSDRNATGRFIAAALFLLVGAGALVYAFRQLGTPEAGWQAIQAGTGSGPTCGEEFVFLYELGAGGQPVLTESRAVTAEYTKACRKAFQMFHTSETFEDTVSLCEISGRPNQELEVDPALYGAFAAVREEGDRTVYLGPVYARYGDLFYCTDDSQLADFDPYSSEEVAREYAAATAYAMDPAHIDVELLGENRVRLRVSEEYLAFAQREGIERFLDFGWMRNAFAADYLAQTMAEAGFTKGSISSIDGFIRCLDGREGSYSLNLYDVEGEKPVQAGVLEYQGPMSLVSLRAFPLNEGDRQRCYRLRNGELRTMYLDPRDGRCKNALNALTCYAGDRTCAQLAMAAAPIFIADTFETGPLERLAEKGVYAACFRAGALWRTEPQP